MLAWRFQSDRSRRAGIEHRLHAAAMAGRWSEVLVQADALARLSPSDALAARMKRLAWEHVGFSITQPCAPAAGATPIQLEAPHPPSARSTRQNMANRRDTKRDTMTGDGQSDRRMLWIDAVGGFLVCLDSEVTIGQPAAGATPGLAILADISRRHAVLRRESGSYVLEPFSPVKVDGRAITGPTPLPANCEVELGPVRLRISRPHALSATAVVKVLSGHRTVPAADAVLLLGESCVLGPKQHSHIRCWNWGGELIIYRQGERLCCRSGGGLSVDGVPVAGEAILLPGARIEGQDFALSIEQA